MSRLKLFAIAFAAGVCASVSYDGSGVGFGDVGYRYWRFLWRGRSIEVSLEDRPQR